MEKLQAFFVEGHQFIFFCHLSQNFLMTFFFAPQNLKRAIIFLKRATFGARSIGWRPLLYIEDCLSQCKIIFCSICQFWEKGVWPIRHFIVVTCPVGHTTFSQSWQMLKRWFCMMVNMPLSKGLGNINKALYLITCSHSTCSNLKKHVFSHLFLCVEIPIYYKYFTTFDREKELISSITRYE